MVKAMPLCQPAQIFLIFIIVTVIVMILSAFMSNMKLNKNQGKMFFMALVIAVLLQLMYGFFITGVLDYLCKSGREDWSWFIIISMVVIVVLVGMTGMKLDKLA